MFVEAWTGIWFGFVENMFMFARQAKSKKLVVFSRDNCHPSLDSFTNNGRSLTYTAWSLTPLEGTRQQLFL